VRLGQPLRPIAEPIHNAGPEVFDQGIGGVEQAFEQFAIAGGFNVENDALFPAIEAHEIGRFAVNERSEGPCIIASTEPFDFDDQRTEVCKKHRAVRSREHPREIKNGTPANGPLVWLGAVAKGIDLAPVLGLSAVEAQRAAGILNSARSGARSVQRCMTRVSFGKIFNMGSEFARDGSEFDRLFHDGDDFAVGSIPAIALHVPGHTPADTAYVIGSVVFVGDTIFMPDYGTARANFPGGDVRQLYRSIRRLLSLPDSPDLYLCHDYKPSGRDHYTWRTTVAEERNGNVHVHDGVSEDAFVAMRNQRDARMPMPKLPLPSVQVNMRAGNLPAPEQKALSEVTVQCSLIRSHFWTELIDGWLRSDGRKKQPGDLSSPVLYGSVGNRPLDI